MLAGKRIILQYLSFYEMLETSYQIKMRMKKSFILFVNSGPEL